MHPPETLVLDACSPRPSYEKAGFQGEMHGCDYEAVNSGSVGPVS